MNDAVEGFALAVVIVGLALTTFVTRTSFLLAGSRLRLGHKVETALRYAPVCTLAAIIVPVPTSKTWTMAGCSLARNAAMAAVRVSG